jgi:guanyl-specific ribonuclease Sa
VWNNPILFVDATGNTPKWVQDAWGATVQFGSNFWDGTKQVAAVVWDGTSNAAVFVWDNGLEDVYNFAIGDDINTLFFDPNASFGDKALVVGLTILPAGKVAGKSFKLVKSAGSNVAINAIRNVKLSSLPDNVQDMFKKYDAAGWKGSIKGQTPGTGAGARWDNDKNQLPTKTKDGSTIKYKEFDINNKIPGRDRDDKRFVWGDDGSVYYTSDHYTTFVKIR